MTVTQKIIEIFDDYLYEYEKGNPEESRIYGKEYSDLETKITKVIESEQCLITTNFPTFKAELKVENGVIHVKSDSLSDYIEKYSME